MVFDKAKMLKQAYDLKKILESIMVEVNEGGVKVKVRGDMKVLLVEVDGEVDERVKKAVNKGLKEAQKKVEKNARGKMGDLGFPGL